MLTLKGGDGRREMRETEGGAREQEKGRTLVSTAGVLLMRLIEYSHHLEVDCAFYRGGN